MVVKGRTFHGIDSYLLGGSGGGLCLGLGSGLGGSSSGSCGLLGLGGSRLLSCGRLGLGLGGELDLTGCTLGEEEVSSLSAAGDGLVDGAVEGSVGLLGLVLGSDELLDGLSAQSGSSLLRVSGDGLLDLVNCVQVG